MDQKPVVPMISESDASDRVSAVFTDIRETRQTDFINNFWRVIANDPAQLERTWGELKEVMAPGELDPLMKELIYIAVSMVNGCEYCIRSHTASASAKGATDGMLSELRAVVAAAARTNLLANGMRVPVDPEFLPGSVPSRSGTFIAPSAVMSDRVARHPSHVRKRGGRDYPVRWRDRRANALSRSRHAIPRHA